MRPCPMILPALLVLVGCAHPALEALRKQPHPALCLDLTIPEQPEAAAMKQAFRPAFDTHFAGGLDRSGTERPDRLQLLVVVGNRLVRTEGEARLNTGTDQVSAVASGSPLRMALSVLGPKSSYEAQVERLGYRPGLLTVQVVVLKVGRDGFQETLKLDPMAIVRRMRPLGEGERNLHGILAEEGRALALEALDQLKQKVGWEPPAA